MRLAGGAPPLRTSLRKFFPRPQREVGKQSQVLGDSGQYAGTLQLMACYCSDAETRMEKKPRIFTISFGSVYPLYVEKAEKKGRTKAEVDEIISWLTGYSAKQIQRAIDDKVDFETFFAKAPRLNANVSLITGVVCGVRVENVTDPLMQKIRYLDKLIDELAKGKKMASILRQ